jgi:hypothetical protein
MYSDSQEALARLYCGRKLAISYVRYFRLLQDIIQVEAPMSGVDGGGVGDVVVWVVGAASSVENLTAGRQKKRQRSSKYADSWLRLLFSYYCSARSAGNEQTIACGREGGAARDLRLRTGRTTIQVAWKKQKSKRRPIPV